jgi:hypothetical protein
MPEISACREARGAEQNFGEQEAHLRLFPTGIAGIGLRVDPSGATWPAVFHARAPEPSRRPRLSTTVQY